MESVTVTLPDDLAGWVRVRVAEGDRSVSRWIAELLAGMRRREPALGRQVRLHEVFPALAASVLVYVGLSLLTRPVTDPRVRGSSRTAPARRSRAQCRGVEGRRTRRDA